MIIHSFTTFRHVFAEQPYEFEPSGYEKWPLERVRADGFVDISQPGIPDAPAELFPLRITVNDRAFDAVPFVDEYDWYVSQRTDDTSKIFIGAERYDGAFVSRSGTIQILLTDLAFEYLDIIDLTPNPEQLQRIFKHVTVYCQRRSDKATQLVQPLYTLTTPVTEPEPV